MTEETHSIPPITPESNRAPGEVAHDWDGFLYGTLREPPAGVCGCPTPSCPTPWVAGARARPIRLHSRRTDETRLGLLNYRAIAKTIASIVLQTDESVTIGVHGSWGVGK